jgi:NADH-ubiquinone oxidoreductase chain 6
MNTNLNFIVILDNYTDGYYNNFLNILTFLSIILSILTITSKNPVLSLLFLIGLFLNISIYLILLGLTFIGISYLLVYIGAISMLFLFILMLIDVRISELHVQTNNSLFLAFLISIIFYINNMDVNFFVKNTNKNINFNILDC